MTLTSSKTSSAYPKVTYSETDAQDHDGVEHGEDQDWKSFDKFSPIEGLEGRRPWGSTSFARIVWHSQDSWSEVKFRVRGASNVSCSTQARVESTLFETFRAQRLLSVQ